ncbi:MAG TPA: hypothetical protein ENG87_00535 [Candidatus Pacearchaeota archaeon]|nr:hypothetical protein BMS3Abin17_00658 [archaeon BMS3Abin17]HDK41835.1 hypothetical protein [Candidatus Pacearchaeota archaeon]HDZ60527.1 hypothetical protein [Candidatus Pacearchaeota archaeon]
MPKDSRTLLKEYNLNGKKVSLENKSYSVIACRLVAMGGFESNRIEAKVMDGHYLITNTETWRENWDRHSIAIVDINKPKKAANRMYKEAKKIAKERAKQDKNKVLDLTSRGKKITGNDKYYISDKSSQKAVA